MPDQSEFLAFHDRDFEDKRFDYQGCEDEGCEDEGCEDEDSGSVISDKGFNA